MENHRRLIISDMDRTLVDFTSRYMDAYRIAVREAYGFEGQPQPHKHSGYTQAAVVRMICEDRGLDRGVTEAGLVKALSVLSATVISSLEDDLRYGILPGVEQVFAELQHQGHAIALVTGTIAPIAEAVLSRTGLGRFFPARACGDEAMARPDLLRLAIRRAQDASGIHVNSSNVVVLGDAITDIEAGKAIGARVVAVATGHHTVRELAEHGADAVLPDLGDKHAALDAILS
jgi:phosphoglycolate phosphatase